MKAIGILLMMLPALFLIAVCINAGILVLMLYVMYTIITALLTLVPYIGYRLFKGKTI